MLVLASGCHNSQVACWDEIVKSMCHTYLKGASLRHSHLDIIGLHSLAQFFVYNIQDVSQLFMSNTFKSTCLNCIINLGSITQPLNAHSHSPLLLHLILNDFMTQMSVCYSIPFIKIALSTWNIKCFYLTFNTLEFLTLFQSQEQLSFIMSEASLLQIGV